MRSFGNQGEMFRGFHAPGHVEFRARGGQIANHAGNGDGVKLDGSGGDYGVPQNASPFGYGSTEGGAHFNHFEGIAALKAAVGPQIVAFSTRGYAAKSHGRNTFATGWSWMGGVLHILGNIDAAARASYPHNYLTPMAKLLKINGGGTAELV